MNVELKLKLEKVYKEYCMKELDTLSESNLSETEKEDNEMFKSFVKFRLSVSGGSVSSMGDIGFGTVEGFVNEIILYNNLMDDGSGCYRGDYSYEQLEALEEVLNKNEIDDEIKSKVVKLFEDNYGWNE